MCGRVEGVRLQAVERGTFAAVEEVRKLNDGGWGRSELREE